MLVSELRKKLKGVNPNIKVRLDTHQGGFTHGVTVAETVTCDDGHKIFVLESGVDY